VNGHVILPNILDATPDNPLNDADRFTLALSQITGKRLTYEHLTGKDREPRATVN
jgi:hypothetical protein